MSQTVSKARDLIAEATDSILSQVAAQRGVTKEELLRQAERQLTEGNGPVAVMASPVTVIDQGTGAVSQRRKGVMKGFGRGFREWAAKGTVNIGAEVNTGQFPENHPDPTKAGKWAIQIMIDPFEAQVAANAMADQITPVIEGIFGVKALVRQ